MDRIEERNRGMTVQALIAPDKTAQTVRNGHAAQRSWRYEDYLQLPDDGKRYEIIEGVLYVANAPTIEHQYAVGEAFAYLRQFVRDQQLGIDLQPLSKCIYRKVQDRCNPTFSSSTRLYRLECLFAMGRRI